MNPKSSPPPFWRRFFAPKTLFAAIAAGHVESCRQFIRTDPAALRQTDEAGRTPLHLAAHKGDIKIVRLFLSSGADLHARDAEQATVLHWAAVGGQREVVAALLAAGADVQAIDQHALTPAQVAQMRGHPELAQFLNNRRPRL